jgi:GT2 family glycosyltransferase
MLGVLLLNYNSSSFIPELYKNLCFRIGLDTKDWVFLIVNNSENENEQNVIRSFCLDKSNIVLLNTSNEGYARGNNIGMRYLYNLNVKYCLLINPDILFISDNVFKGFFDSIQILNNTLVVGPRIYNRNGSLSPAFPKLTIWQSIFGFKAVNKLCGTNEVVSTMGCCLFFDIDKFSLLDYFDENTFLYREENILAEKLSLMKFKWVETDTVSIIHNHIRKNGSFKTFIMHRFYEYQSTFYYFSFYLKKSSFMLLTYKLLFLVKSILYFVYLMFKKI